MLCLRVFWVSTTAAWSPPRRRPQTLERCADGCTRYLHERTTIAIFDMYFDEESCETFYYYYDVTPCWVDEDVSRVMMFWTRRSQPMNLLLCSVKHVRDTARRHNTPWAFENMNPLVKSLDPASCVAYSWRDIWWRLTISTLRNACETSRGIERRNRDLYVSDRVPSMWYCLWRESYHFDNVIMIRFFVCGEGKPLRSLKEGGDRLGNQELSEPWWDITTWRRQGLLKKTASCEFRGKEKKKSPEIWIPLKPTWGWQNATSNV